MPFASSIRPDTTTYENFQFCTNAMASQIMGRALDPVNTMFSLFTDALKPVVGELDSFRGMITGLQTFVTSFVGQTFSKMGTVFGTVVSLMQRVRDLAGRIVGSMTYAVVISSTAVNLIESLFGAIRTMLSSVIAIIFGLAIIILFVFPPLLFVMIPIGISLGISYECFDPQTPIDLADGRTVPLHRIRVGDVLANKATILFGKQHVPVVNIYRKLTSVSYSIQ